MKAKQLNMDEELFGKELAEYFKSREAKKKVCRCCKHK